MLLPLLGLLVGVLLGLVLNVNVGFELSRYSAVAILAALDSVLGAVRAELDSVYDKVVAQIRAQYTLGYHSTNEKTDGAWRKVDIKVLRKDVRVRARKGYFGAYKQQ